METPAGFKTFSGNYTYAKTNPISEDYVISKTVLGLGINGKVVQCNHKKSGNLYALKVRLYLYFFDDLLVSPESY